MGAAKYLKHVDTVSPIKRFGFQTGEQGRQRPPVFQRKDACKGWASPTNNAMTNGAQWWAVPSLHIFLCALRVFAFKRR